MCQPQAKIFENLREVLKKFASPLLLKSSPLLESPPFYRNFFIPPPFWNFWKWLSPPSIRGGAHYDFYFDFLDDECTLTVSDQIRAHVPRKNNGVAPPYLLTPWLNPLSLTIPPPIKVCVNLNDAFYSFAYWFFYLIPIYFIFGRAIVMMFRRPMIRIKIKN